MRKENEGGCMRVCEGGGEKIFMSMFLYFFLSFLSSVKSAVVVTHYNRLKFSNACFYFFLVLVRLFSSHDIGINRCTLLWFQFQPIGAISCTVSYCHLSKKIRPDVSCESFS